MQWEAPAEGTALPPLVCVHGGGGQSTDWFGVSADAPGWAPRAVEVGYPVYLLDRPGHGRSPYDPTRLGERTPFPDYAGAAALFAPDPGDPTPFNPAWEWERLPGSPELDALVASSGGILLNTALSQELDARRLVDLLERTGPAFLITHSAGSSAGWLAASRAPALVRGIVAVEPIGPPCRDLGPRGSLEYGVTAVPLDGVGRRPLEALPVLIVSGEASGRAENDAATTAFLADRGASATHVRLGDLGVTGNGHGLILEANAGHALAPVLRWLATQQAQ
ncbi:alpha/beta fold hydrolase [Leifsonia kafniensis]|uniref:Alpha/beta fold hydrolase n=1 Tax=Leifsonia kafniensis TaxID=475957 RepID=A0ABP7KRY7_9MICO